MKSLMVRKRRTNKQTNKNKLRSVLQGIGPQCREENKEGGRSGAEEGVSGSSLALGLKAPPEVKLKNSEGLVLGVA